MKQILVLLAFSAMLVSPVNATGGHDGGHGGGDNGGDGGDGGLTPGASAAIGSQGAGPAGVGCDERARAPKGQSCGRRQPSSNISELIGK